jgi:mono/diheme cytochrome c family protein
LRLSAAAGPYLALAVALAVIASAPAGADEAAVARGGYLAAAAGCDQCHTDKKEGAPAYAGGRRLATEFGVVTTPNITPDRAAGIGGWSETDFIQAMRWGVAPDGSHYVSAFPFPYYARLTDSDLRDLKEYLDSLAPVSRPVTEAAASLALFERARAAVGVALGSLGLSAPVTAPPDNPPAGPAVARGAYLAQTVGHCGACHTPRTWLGQPDGSRELAGSAGGLQGAKAPNITPDEKTGIGGWSEADILSLLKDGQTPYNDFVGGAMAEIVRNTARLTDDDRRAIAAYLKSLPAKHFDKKG